MLMKCTLTLFRCETAYTTLFFMMGKRIMSANSRSKKFHINFFFLFNVFVVRLYDTSTGQCFVASNPREYHTGPVNMVSS